MEVFEFEGMLRRRDLKEIFDSNFPGMKECIEGKLEIDIGDVEFLDIRPFIYSFVKKEEFYRELAPWQKVLVDRVVLPLGYNWHYYTKNSDVKNEDFAFTGSRALVGFNSRLIVKDKLNLNGLMHVQLHELAHIAHMHILDLEKAVDFETPEYIYEGFAEALSGEIMAEMGYEPVSSEGKYEFYRQKFVGELWDGRVGDYLGIKEFLREVEGKS